MKELLERLDQLERQLVDAGGVSFTLDEIAEYASDGRLEEYESLVATARCTNEMVQEIGQTLDDALVIVRAVKNLVASLTPAAGFATEVTSE